MCFIGKYLWFCLLLFCLFGCYKETPVKIDADFVVEVIGEDYSVPVVVRVVNKTAGADGFTWTFQGGVPEMSNSVNPGEVVYNTPGTYTINLQAWNSTERKSKELTVQVDSALHVGFEYTVLDNEFAPVSVVIENKSKGGIRYRWEFEEALPAYSDSYDPPVILYPVKGEHAVRLTVFSAHDSVSCLKVIKVLPSLSVDFECIPFPGHEDMEVPFRGWLENRSESALYYYWRVSGALIKNDTARRPEIYIESPGTYGIILEADNLKEKRRVEKKITVLSNTNLYVHRDLQFGITAARDKVGCFYAAGLKKNLKANEISVDNGSEIDLVFWGMGEKFQKCRFLSPHLAGQFAFPDIPFACRTKVMKIFPGEGEQGITYDDFDRMTDDALLGGITIYDDPEEKAYFDAGGVLPLILFETADGRKGIVCVRDFVSEGSGSYVLADVKIQKKKR